MENVTETKLAELSSALADFARSLDIDESAFDPDIGDLISGGKIQKFEVCTELLWKTMKGFLFDVYGVDLASPKPVMKAFYANGLCQSEEYETLIEIIDERNRLSHLYRKSMILPLLGRLRGYHEIMKNAYHAMKSVSATGGR